MVSVGIVLGLLAWLYFDSRGLPDEASIQAYSPNAQSLAVDPCTHAISVAVPYAAIGENLRAALEAQGARQGRPGVLRYVFSDLAGGRSHHEVLLSQQIARTLICGVRKPLERDVDEIRLAAQLERHFSQEQLFAIYANRLYFGEGAVGIEEGAQYYFRRTPNELSLGEAALLAGMVASPNYFSPRKHLDRSLARRNELIDAMAAGHLISAPAAIAAKREPISTSPL